MQFGENLVISQPKLNNLNKDIMKTLIITLFCGLMTVNTLFAKEFERPASVDYQKGVEALNEGDIEQAYTCLTNELNAHPKNGYAHCYMALVCNFCGDAKLAFHAVNESLRFIPKADTEYRAFAYYTRGMLLMNAQAYDEAEKDLNEAIRLTPSDVENYKARAEVYMNMGKYEESLADLQTAMKLDSHADVYDLMMQLLEANPDPVFFDQVTSAFSNATASR